MFFTSHSSNGQCGIINEKDSYLKQFHSTSITPRECGRWCAYIYDNHSSNFLNKNLYMHMNVNVYECIYLSKI